MALRARSMVTPTIGIETGKRTYPYLGRMVEAKKILIILFNSSCSGTVVYNLGYTAWKLGEQSHCLVEEKFAVMPKGETVVITNEAE